MYILCLFVLLSLCSVVLGSWKLPKIERIEKKKKKSWLHTKTLLLSDFFRCSLLQSKSMSSQRPSRLKSNCIRQPYFCYDSKMKDVALSNEALLFVHFSIHDLIEIHEHLVIEDSCWHQSDTVISWSVISWNFGSSTRWFLIFLANENVDWNRSRNLFSRASCEKRLWFFSFRWRLSINSFLICPKSIVFFRKDPCSCERSIKFRLIIDHSPPKFIWRRIEENPWYWQF